MKAMMVGGAIALLFNASVASALPLCQPNDSRTRVPVWTPTLDAQGNLPSAPPQEDGQIVFIQLYRDVENVTCNDTALNSFALPTNAREPMGGGLSVNLKGNTQSTNGMCYFSGYFMNKTVFGMHQGWVETYFEAVDQQQLVISGNFCLARRV